MSIGEEGCVRLLVCVRVLVRENEHRKRQCVRVLIRENEHRGGGMHEIIGYRR
jgi:hypothetical protein